MPRKARVEFAGAVYHVLDRGDRREARKLAIARLIRSRTSVPNKWIADELSLGHVYGVSRYCSQSRSGTEIPRELAGWVEAGSV